MPDPGGEIAPIDDLRYLNMDELCGFCRRHDVPRHIEVERPDGTRVRTRDRDRKDVLLQRVLDLALRGERASPTVYGHAVVCDDPLPERLTPLTRLHFGQYDKRSDALMAMLGQLTGDRFRSGMIARLTLREFWTRGEAPTLRRFADAWLEASENHTRPRPEAAYLSDRFSGDAGPRWKELRRRRAERALARLEELVAERSP